MYLFSKGKQEKENRSLPQVHQNEEPSAKTRPFNSPDKLVLIGIPKPTARTPRRQESSYTWSMILSFLENLPKTRFDATRQPWWARCAMWLRAKKAPLMRRQSAAPRWSRYVGSLYAQKRAAPPLIFVPGSNVEPSSHLLWPTSRPDRKKSSPAAPETWGHSGNH